MSPRGLLGVVEPRLLFDPNLHRCVGAWRWTTSEEALAAESRSPYSRGMRSLYLALLTRALRDVRLGHPDLPQWFRDGDVQPFSFAACCLVLELGEPDDVRAAILKAPTLRLPLREAGQPKKHRIGAKG